MKVKQKLRLKKYGLPAFITAVILLTVYVLFSTAAYVTARLVTASSRDSFMLTQVERLDALKESYETGTAIKADERSFCAFDLQRAYEDGVKLNQLRFFGTHNSYKQGLTKATAFLNHYAFFQGNYRFDYTFDTLTNQLNMGIRGLELDIGNIDNGGKNYFECAHISGTDEKSSCTIFELALREIKMWSDYNPGHLPIQILLECKKGAGRSKDFALDDLLRLDELFRRTLGDSLYTPADMLGEYEDFAALTASDGYPALKDTAGKIMILLHDIDAMDDYIASGATLRTQAAFPILVSKRLLEEGETECLAYTPFFMHNEATETDKIAELIDGYNLIIRTMVDNYDRLNQEKHDLGVYQTKANFLSTDYPPAAEAYRNHPEFASYIDNAGHLISLRGI